MTNRPNEKSGRLSILRCQKLKNITQIWGLPLSQNRFGLWMSWMSASGQAKLAPMVRLSKTVSLI